MRLGEKLKTLRAKKNMTQEQLGNVLHVSRATVSSWEVSRTYPDLESLVKISDYFEISLDILLREDKKMVEEIDKDIKRGKKLQRWLFGLMILFLLWTVGSLLLWRYPIFNQSFPFEPAAVQEAKLANKKLSIELDKENLRKIVVIDQPELVEGTIYIHALRKLSLFTEERIEIDLSNFNFEDVERIVLVTELNESVYSESLELNWLAVPDEHKKIIWEK